MFTFKGHLAATKLLAQVKHGGVLDIDLALQKWHRKAVVSSKRAHKVLQRMRKDLTVAGINPAAPLGFSEETVDMTDLDTEEFDWRGYVCNRKSEEQLRELVGEGITRFELRFLTMAWDANLNQARCDFVAHRVDNMREVPCLRLR